MTENKGFEGEEAGTGNASPALDLAASAFLIALSVWVMFEAVALDMPGDLTTAPGLLPFIAAGSLCAMALILAVGAWRRRSQPYIDDSDEEAVDPARTIGLMAAVAVYLAALQLLGFEYRFEVSGMWLAIGSFEIVTTIVLTAILGFFWGAALWACFSVSLVWTLLLAGAFRYIFSIPLPG